MYYADELQVSSLSVVRPMLNTRLYLHTAHTRRIVWEHSNSIALSTICGTRINKTGNVRMNPTLNGVRVTILHSIKKQ
jgi:hypothetical protein